MPWSIRRWLEDVGLPKYSDNFEHHDIAVDILPCLTKEDLEDLGVRTIGDRRRLFSAIKLLQIEAQEPLSKKTVAASRRPSGHRLERSRSRTLHDALSCAAPGSPSSETSSALSCSPSRSIHNFVWRWGNRRVVIVGDSIARGLEGIFRRRYYISTSWQFEVHSGREALSVKKISQDYDLVIYLSAGNAIWNPKDKPRVQANLHACDHEKTIVVLLGSTSFWNNLAKYERAPYSFFSWM